MIHYAPGKELVETISLPQFEYIKRANQTVQLFYCVHPKPPLSAIFCILHFCSKKWLVFDLSK